MTATASAQSSATRNDTEDNTGERQSHTRRRERKGPSGYFGFVPATAAEDRGLSKGALRALVVLASYVNPGGWAWPATETLARRLGVDRRSVRRWLIELEDHGHIRSWPFMRATGGHGSNWYRVAPWFDGATMPPPERRGSVGPTAAPSEAEGVGVTGAPRVGAIVAPRGEGDPCAMNSDLLNSFNEQETGTSFEETFSSESEQTVSSGQIHRAIMQATHGDPDIERHGPSPWSMAGLSWREWQRLSQHMQSRILDEQDQERRRDEARMAAVR